VKGLREKKAALRELGSKIEKHEGWWIFPEESPIQGFMGAGSVFIVGDQPSKSDWEVGHPNRTAFYRTLQKVGIHDAHLTDIYKRRGECSELNIAIPADFEDHVKFLKQEIEIVKPTYIVALGVLAQRVLIQKVLHRSIPRMWHFNYVVRAHKIADYAQNMREAIWG
jgi:hypothetical protein